MVLSCNLIILLTPAVLISSLAVAAASVIVVEIVDQPLLRLDVPQVGGHDLGRDRRHAETGDGDDLAVDDVGRLVLAVEDTGGLGRDPDNVVGSVASVEREPDPSREVEVEH